MAETGPRQWCFHIGCTEDVVDARRSGLTIAIEMGFHHSEANQVAVVISELGRNIEQYAGEGSITVITDDASIEIVAEDQGPGITELEQVLAGGYTTSNGLGLGVSGSRRLMDEFEVHSAAGQGTMVRARKLLQ